MSSDIPGCFGCAAPLLDVQVWLSHHLHGHAWAVAFMRSIYGWPFCEIVHFLGLTLLVGTIGMFDLRVLGVAKRIPIGALHRLAPWGVAGYGLNVATGLMFLMASPDQYLYQWPFLLKMLFMGIAGLNALVFNLAVLPKISRLAPGEDAPPTAKVMCALSLCLWVAVIFAGRFLAFHKAIFSVPPP